MYIVILRYTDKKDRATELMDSHMAHLMQGFADGVFLVGGSIQSDLGGGLIAHGVSRAELEARVHNDPFVAEGIVRLEILEVVPLAMDERLRPILLQSL